MSIYKDYFDGITPEKDNEKFTESIINAEKPKMKMLLQSLSKTIPTSFLRIL